MPVIEGLFDIDFLKKNVIPNLFEEEEINEN